MLGPTVAFYMKATFLICAKKEQKIKENLQTTLHQLCLKVFFPLF